MKIAPSRQTSERRSREEQPCCLSWLWTDVRAILNQKWENDNSSSASNKASKAVTMFESKKERKTWGLLFLFINHLLDCYWVTMLASFRCTTVWVSSVHTDALPPEAAPPSSPTPLGHPGAGAELLLLQQLPPAPCFTRGRVLIAVPLFQFVPLSPSPPPNPCCVSIISDIFISQRSRLFISSPRRLPVPHSSDGRAGVGRLL